MTPSTIDRPELEERVRAALRSRARETVVDVPDSFTPGAFVPLGAGRSRRTLLVAAAALAIVVLGIAALAIRNDDGVDSATEETPEGTAPGTQVHGPTGSAWFVLDLPGLAFQGANRQSTEALPGGLPELQTFRTDEGFDGPTVWLEPAASASGGEGATEVTVQGETAYVRQDGDVVRLASSREGGIYVIAVHLTVDDVVAFASGLEPRDGGGWDATALPQGLAEVTEEEPPLPPSEHTELSYTGPDGANYELFVNPGGQAVFEDWAREFAANGGTIEAISVDGRPGMLTDSGGGEMAAVWRPTDDVVADFRTSLDREGLLAAMEALRPVSEADWGGNQEPAAGG